jgi:hypothetical protein
MGEREKAILFASLQDALSLATAGFIALSFFKSMACNELELSLKFQLYKAKP